MMTGAEAAPRYQQRRTSDIATGQGTSNAALPDPEAARSRFHSGKRAGGNCTEGQYCIASPGLSGATLNRFAGPKRVNSESLRRPAAGQHTEIRRFAGPQRGNTEVLR